MGDPANEFEVQAITNYTYDSVNRAVKTTPISIFYITYIDEASATVTYVGKALPGSLTSASVWQIQKIDTTTGTVITFADGDGEFDNEWDNRATLVYL